MDLYNLYSIKSDAWPTLVRALPTESQRENLNDEIQYRNRNLMAEENFYRYHLNLWMFSYNKSFLKSIFFDIQSDWTFIEVPLIFRGEPLRGIFTSPHGPYSDSEPRGRSLIWTVLTWTITVRAKQVTRSKFCSWVLFNQVSLTRMRINYENFICSKFIKLIVLSQYKKNQNDTSQTNCR